MNEKRILDFAKDINLPEVGVCFESGNKVLQDLVHKADKLSAGNLRDFPPQFPVLIESKGYSRLYTETQPMGGEMYAKRDLRSALNNQLLFMLCQREDGRLSGGIFPPSDTVDWRTDQYCRWVSPQWLNLGLLADFGHLQGNALPGPAFKMYYLIGKNKEYLHLLAECLKNFDDYLWNTRDPYNEGVLQSWCIWDTGEDNCTRFAGSPNCWPHDYPPDKEHTPNPGDPEDRMRYYLRSDIPDTLGKDSVNVPFRSMDMMAYSYDNRMTLAMISDELGDGKSGFWRDEADKVRTSFKKHLWRPELGAAYDRDRTNEFMDVLLHNNLRCMWHGLFDQSMAVEFVSRHLFNKDEFFTPVPLPSIAANDPLFRSSRVNDWSGPSMGLTWQRLIGALEKYGYYSELTKLGRIFIKVIENAGVFVQEYNPFDPEDPVAESEKKRDGYGPTLLSFLELISRFYGIYIEKENVFWSGLTDGSESKYVQKFADKRYEIVNNGNKFTAYINGIKKFSCSSGVRVVSSLDGIPTRIVGIDTEEHQIDFCIGEKKQIAVIKPNQVLEI